MPKTNFPAVAKRLRSAVKKNLAKELKTWSGKEDADMRKMSRGDAKDGNTVANYIEKGNVKRALEKMHDMDTSAGETVGCLLAKTSPMFYVKFLEPDGWVEVWHLNDEFLPPTDDPEPKLKRKTTIIVPELIVAVSVSDYGDLDLIARSIMSSKKKVKSYEVGFGEDCMYWGVIYTGKQTPKKFAELCAANGYVENPED